MIVLYIVLALVSYFLGALPTAYLVAKKLTGQDIRTMGSGNVGSTNAVRVLGRKLGYLIFAVDLLKGFIPALVGLLVQGPILGMVCGGLAFIGHIYPVWLQFRGGKGVATAVGAALALCSLAAVAVLVIWLLTLLLTDCVAVASCAAAAALPAILFFSGADLAYCLGFSLLALIMLYKHRGNFVALKHK